MNVYVKLIIFILVVAVLKIFLLPLFMKDCKPSAVMTIMTGLEVSDAGLLINPASFHTPCLSIYFDKNAYEKASELDNICVAMYYERDANGNVSSSMSDGNIRVGGE